jgi:hypothetical protein
MIVILRPSNVPSSRRGVTKTGAGDRPAFALKLNEFPLHGRVAATGGNARMSRRLQAGRGFAQPNAGRACGAALEVADRLRGIESDEFVHKARRDDVHAARIRAFLTI